MSQTHRETEIDPLADRAFFRVRTRLPVIYEPVAPEGRKALAAELLGAIDPPPIELDAGLVAWLDAIERKLDLVLDALNVETRPLLRSSDETSMLLSGSGMSFEADRGFEMGSELLLTFELPGDRTRLIRCIATVVHSAPSAEGPGVTVGAAFETIRPSDVDAVVEYTVAVQRQQFRAAHDRDGVAR